MRVPVILQQRHTEAYRHQDNALSSLRRRGRTLQSIKASELLCCKTSHKHKDPTNHEFWYPPDIGPWSQELRSLSSQRVQVPDIYGLGSQKPIRGIFVGTRSLKYAWTLWVCFCDQVKQSSLKTQVRERYPEALM